MWVFILAFLVGKTFAQVPYVGRCPNITTMENIELEKYKGIWYEAERYPTFFEVGARCVTAEYTFSRDINPNSMNITNSRTTIFSSKPRTTHAIATIKGEQNQGKFTLEYSLPFRRELKYWILKTDYTNYSIVYSCTEKLVIHTRYLWILTRNRSASNEILNNAHLVLPDKDLSKTFLVKTNQDDCTATQDAT